MVKYQKGCKKCMDLKFTVILFSEVTVMKKRSHPTASAFGIGAALGGTMAAVMLAIVYFFILRGW